MPKPLIWIVLFLGAMIVAAVLDAPVARAVRSSGLERWMDERTRDATGRKVWSTNRIVSEGLKLPGEYAVVVGCALLAAAVHRYRWRAGVFVLVATLVSGLNGLIKWVVGRHRPFRFPPLDELTGDGLFAPFQFMFFRGGIEGLLDGRNLSFPSGHASLAFALATAMTLLFPRWAAVFFALAAACGLQRIAENAHWVSDVVGAAGLGVGGVLIVRAILLGWMRAGEVSGVVDVTKEQVR